MTMRTVVRAVLLGALVAATGCATHYRVTDPGSGKAYYTDDISNLKGGGVRFQDAATGANVVLQSSVVREIDSAEYDKGVAAKGGR